MAGCSEGISGKDSCIKKSYTQDEIQKLVNDYNKQNQFIDKQQRKWLDPKEYLQRRNDRKKSPIKPKK